MHTQDEAILSLDIDILALRIRNKYRFDKWGTLERTS